MPTKKPLAESSFNNRVKAVVKNIPKGETLSHKQVPTLAGNADAARAVARVMAAN